MDNNQNQQSGSEYLKFDKRVLILSIRKHLLMIIISAMVATIGGFIFAKLFITDTWKVQSVMIRHKKNLDTKTNVPYLYTEMDYNTILQSVKTRRNLQSVINTLELYTTPDKLYGAINVSRGSRSNLINIKVEYKNRKNAVDIANTLADVYIQSYIDILNSSTDKIFRYYLKQDQIYQNKINDHEDRLYEFRSKNKILSLEKEIQNKYENLKILELDLINLQMVVSELATKILDISGRIEILPSKVEISSSVSGTKRKRLKNLQEQLAIFREKYTEKNPKIIKLINEIAQLEKTITETSDEEEIPDFITFGKNGLRQDLIFEKTQLENQLVASTQKIEKYTSKIEIIKTQLKILSPIEREYYSILNDLEISKEQLKKVKDRANEAKIAMESNLSDIEVLEKAEAPKYPLSSGRKLVALVFGFLAFAILSLYYALKELMDFSVKSPFDFTEVIKIKMLEEIPNKDNVSPQIFYSKMQILYGQLVGYLDQSKTSLVAIGKDSYATGATFIIQELAELALSQNKKILWIESVVDVDEDIMLHEMNRKLYDDKNRENNFYELTDKLHVAYFICDNDTFKKVLSKEQIKDFLANLDEYDFIFWEMFSVDYNLQLFNTIASSSDLLVFVARFKQSSRFKLSHAVRFLKKNCDVPIVGVLNNSVKPYFKE